MADFKTIGHIAELGEQRGTTAFAWTRTLEVLSNPCLDPLFWRAERLGSPSAWWQHVPFAHWIVCATAPRLLVELGTHAGVSYAAFCQAVVRERLATRCHAVDTWRGDPQAGTYGDEVLEELRRFHDERFGAFSTLLQCTFDDALDRIEDGSIDLLHIDGLHTYEAVRHDFESWLPKLSSQAVVMFHDINEREGDFGVWRLWAELRQRYPAFEFLHGHGLGVLAVGQQPPAPVAALCELADSASIAMIRMRFARLGECWLTDTRERMLLQGVEGLRTRAEQAEALAARSEKDVALLGDETARRVTAVEREMAATLTRAEREVAAARTRAEQAEALAQRTKAAFAARASELDAVLARVRAERDSVLASTAWRVTWPARVIGQRIPYRLRRVVRGTAKFGWWTVTMKLPRKLRERQEMLQAYRDAAAVPVPGPDLAVLSQLPEEPPPVPAGAVASAVRPQLDSQDANGPSLVYVSGEPDTPGHRYRVVRPAATAASLGARTCWMHVQEIPARLKEIEAADVLVIWRAPWEERIAAAVSAARQGGAKVVFDVDDLMIVPELAQLNVIDGIRTQYLTEEAVRDHYARMRGTMAAADLCITTTEELAQEIRRALIPAIVLPNGLDDTTIAASRLAARRRRARGSEDKLVRIGYAGGTRTHQRDFALCADAVATVLRTRPECRLVAFHSSDGSIAVLDIDEFPALRGLEDRIEWRNFVPLERLPDEIARFDINLAPLEVGNPFCEAKSELKLFEAALVDVPTIASPTGPYRRAIRHGETGFLAATSGDWHEALVQLISDATMRRRVARAAQRDALWRFGPERRAEIMASLLDFLQGGRRAARSFELDVHRREFRSAEPLLSDHEVVFEADRCGSAEVTVVMPLYNYACYAEEALDSVRAQTLAALDLVVVEDRSTDDSLAVALRWIQSHAARFNRVVLLRNRANSGLARTRNTGFDAAETPYVLALDADNRLLPECTAACLRTAQDTGAAFAYPVIRQFGASQHLLGTQDYDPYRMIIGNYIDAMALISKAAWVAAGGYNHGRGGWEDFAFWCRLMEHGFWGQRVPGGPLAEYRVHANSMMQVSASQPKVMRRMMDEVTAVHPWLRLVWPLPTPEPAPASGASAQFVEGGARLASLLPLLRCPETGQTFALAPTGDALLSEDGSRRWPLVLGRPLLFPGMNTPTINSDAHLSNPLPESALALIHGTTGPVLHLSAGGSARRFEHVIEADAAVFRHTDLIADVHHLPFADRMFDAVIALNAFEHYRDPRAAAREILRVLRPGGRVLIRTAFMQPLHEPPWHFYNCTRYGLEAWFEDFETEKLHVSENFHPGYSLSWLASELELALRARMSDAEADAFLATPLQSVVSLWRAPEATKNGEPLWENLAALPQEAQAVTAAGFEFLGRRPAA
jgi:glycosyltransferase involved in cell wall biosynthesis/SAM-dependent methyltransferase